MTTRSQKSKAFARPPILRPLKWDGVVVGDKLGPVQHRITARMIRDYAESTGDIHQWHIDGAPHFPDAIAHPAMATIFSTRLLGRSGIDRPSGGIHARHEYEFLGLICAGQTLTTTGTITEKYIRRERKYLVCDSLTVDEAGRPVVRCRYTQAVPE
jgi:3-hydroxybutyryl-CoA dehydratase